MQKKGGKKSKKHRKKKQKGGNQECLPNFNSSQYKCPCAYPLDSNKHDIKE